MGKQILSEAQSVKFRLDPRTKLIIMIALNLVIFSGKSSVAVTVMAVMPILLIALSGKIMAAAVCGAICIFAGFGVDLISPIFTGMLSTLIVMFSYTMYRMLPVVIMGYYLVSTTTVSEFVASMERIHAPRQLVIPLSVMFRFFPTVAEEASSIGDAMKMRGIRFGINALEYRVVPLLMSTVKIGDELSAASLTRGLGNPVRRTNICSIGFHIQDIVFTAAAIICLIMFFYAKWSA